MKNMKVLLVGLLSCCLLVAGCNNSNNSTSNTQSDSTSNTTNVSSSDVEKDITITKIVFDGLDDVKANVGDDVSPKKGVTVKAFYSDNGAEKSFVITSYVTITQEGKTITTAFDTQKEGEFVVTYTVDTKSVVGFTFASDVTLSATRKIVVSKAQVSTEELIYNGSFDEGAKGWGEFSDGADVSYDFSKGYMEMTQRSITGNTYSPRINTYTSIAVTQDKIHGVYADADPKDYKFTLQYGVTYQLSIDLWADANKTIQAQIGTFLPAPTYWGILTDTNKENLIHQFNITTERKTHTWQFTLGSNTCTDSYLTLEMGTVAGDGTTTVIRADDISLKALADDGTDHVPPSISNTDLLKVEYVKDSVEEVNVLEGVEIIDNKDKNPKVTTVIKNEAGEAVEKLTKGMKGTFTVEITVTDESGNTSTATRIVRIKEAGASTYEPNYQAGDVAFGEEAKSSDNFLYWNDQNWCGQTVTVSEAKIENNELHLTYTSEGKAFYGAGFQVFYKNTDLQNNEEYKLTLKVNSTVAGKIRVNGEIVDLVVGDNNISVTYTELDGHASLAFINGTFENGVSTTIDAATFVISNIKWAEVNRIKPNYVAGDVAFGEEAKSSDNFLYWNDQNWCGQTVTVSEAKIENNELHLTYTSEGKAFYGAGFQVFYKNTDLQNNEEYKLTLKVNSTVAGKIRVNGEIVDLVVGDNNISVTYTELDGHASLAFINGIFEDGVSTTIDAATFVISEISWLEA